VTAIAHVEQLSRSIRRTIVERSYPVHTGHIGSCLSVTDLVATLFSEVLCRTGAARDRFILSKGHAALALYGALAGVGEITEEQLGSYCLDGSAFGEHPDHVVEGIDFSTGSLGFGLSLGAGTALGQRRRQSGARTFVLLSDAELNEGAVWEAAMFAAHQRLANLVAIFDLNGQQAMGRTAEVLALPALAERWRAFGWDTHEVDGHDHEEISEVLNGLDVLSGAPHVLLAATRFGRGIPFMEGVLGWHYWSMDEERYGEALVALEEAERDAS
jgi:transketolase